MVQKSIQRGRPLGFDPEEALTAAMQLFWERGYEASSIEELEQRTGLSRTSLYNTFGSKRELFSRALERYQRLLADEMLGPLEEGSNGLDDVDSFLGRLATQVKSRSWPSGCLMVNSMTEFGGGDPDIVRRAGGYVRRVRRAIGAALQRAAASGEIPGDGREPKTDLLLALVMGIMVAARSGLPRKETLALVDAARAQLGSWRSAATAAPSPDRLESSAARVTASAG